jgi:hypothetical protein
MHYRYLSFTLIFFLLLGYHAVLAQDLQEMETSYRKDLKKVRQYPGNEERVARLVATYTALNEADAAAVAGLKASGQPDIWYDIYRFLEKTNARQEEIRTLPEKTLLQMNVAFKNLENDLKEAKNRAEKYFYAHASKLLSEEKQAPALSAYQELMLLARLDSKYKDADVLIRKAVMLGATDIQYELFNRTDQPLNTKIVDELSTAVMAYREARFEKMAGEKPGEPFPFVIKIYIAELKVSPEKIKRQDYGEERDIYENGVVVDTIRCTVDQFQQLKGSAISGRIDIYDVSAGMVVNTIPISAETMFVHSYGMLTGDPDAAGEETRILISKKKVEFPSNEAIVMDAVTEFTKEAVKVLIP